MTIILTSQEIAHYRTELAADPEALEALDQIEDCEGDLEDAALSLGIQAGQQPDRTDWLSGVAKRCRVILCQDPCQSYFQQRQLADVVRTLKTAQVCSSLLVTPVVLYVVKTGVQTFCEALNYKQN
ncbi:MAG: hypothetical protein J7545_16530 [Roseofilum sp. SBFL]|uniref:hypothetical protein n=1 Tax=unclassified Roseofilum TaxID=2620099 RepID=UPI001B084E04|nr:MULTISPECIES: hypothetical protein [unclassified Roseofilum]MBP0023524.1 hypothetical protein [Roseofilum sp. SID2]MBP0039648.1 hypothetical protein [Roseofilum sp. SID1]MBP0043551.1 hypothetical protein [Roseofilum sp. SBFL]